MEFWYIKCWELPKVCKNGLKNHTLYRNKFMRNIVFKPSEAHFARTPILKGCVPEVDAFAHGNQVVRGQ